MDKETMKQQTTLLRVASANRLLSYIRCLFNMHNCCFRYQHLAVASVI